MAHAGDLCEESQINKMIIILLLVYDIREHSMRFPMLSAAATPIDIRNSGFGKLVNLLFSQEHENCKSQHKNHRLSSSFQSDINFADETQNENAIYKVVVLHTSSYMAKYFITNKEITVPSKKIHQQLDFIKRKSV